MKISPSDPPTISTAHFESSALHTRISRQRLPVRDQNDCTCRIDGVWQCVCECLQIVAICDNGYFRIIMHQSKKFNFLVTVQTSPPTMSFPEGRESEILKQQLKQDHLQRKVEGVEAMTGMYWATSKIQRLICYAISSYKVTLGCTVNLKYITTKNGCKKTFLLIKVKYG